MNSETFENQGLYSIVQYSNQPERFEYVNFGIVIFHDNFSRVSYRFSDSPREINRVFKISLGQHFEFLTESIQSRLQDEIESLKNNEAINKFILTRAGKVRFSELKPVMVDNIDSTIDYLFQSLVGSKKPKTRRRAAKSILSEKLKNRGIDQFLEKPDPFQLNSGPTIKADFGYQNGAYNFIQAVSLSGSVDAAVKEVGGLNLEGKWLYEETRGPNQKKLNIVADTLDQPSAFVDAVRGVFQTPEVKLIFMNDIDHLVTDIKKSVH